MGIRLPAMQQSTATSFHKSRWHITREERAALFFVLPLMIPLTLYWILPSLASLYFSFTNYNVLQASHWVGLDNFIQLWDDEIFWRSMKNSVYFTAGNIPLMMVAGLC